VGGRRRSPRLPPPPLSLAKRERRGWMK
jgi:hypothetical protein